MDSNIIIYVVIAIIIIVVIVLVFYYNHWEYTLAILEVIVLIATLFILYRQSQIQQNLETEQELEYISGNYKNIQKELMNNKDYYSKIYKIDNENVNDHYNTSIMLQQISDVLKLDKLDTHWDNLFKTWVNTNTFKKHWLSLNKYYDDNTNKYINSILL